MVEMYTNKWNFSSAPKRSKFELYAIVESLDIKLIPTIRIRLNASELVKANDYVEEKKQKKEN